jgi:hypothetical protein
MYFPSSIVRPKMNSLRQSPLGADFQLFDAHDFVRSRLNKCTKNYNCEFRRLALIPRIDIMGFIICSNCIILSLGPNYMRVLCVVLCSNFCSSAARAPIFPLKWPALRKHDIALLSWLVSRDLLQRATLFHLTEPTFAFIFASAPPPD